MNFLKWFITEKIDPAVVIFCVWFAWFIGDAFFLLGHTHDYHPTVFEGIILAVPMVIFGLFVVFMAVLVVATTIDGLKSEYNSAKIAKEEEKMRVFNKLKQNYTEAE